MRERAGDLPVRGQALEQAVELARRGVITHLTTRGERVAAIVPESVFVALRTAEDAEDAAGPGEAMAGPGEAVSWRRIKTGLGL